MKITHPAPSYTDLDIALMAAACEVHPSEVHGLITGLLCSFYDIKGHGWQDFILKEHKSSALLEHLQALMLYTQQQILDFEFNLTLLLPEDKIAIDQRIEALTLWCQGFLTALNQCEQLTLPKIQQKPKNELEELLQDLMEIAQASEDCEQSQANEEAYAELVEYVRMAAIYIYQELHSNPQKLCH